MTEAKPRGVLFIQENSLSAAIEKLQADRKAHRIIIMAVEDLPEDGSKRLTWWKVPFYVVPWWVFLLGIICLACLLLGANE